MTLISQIAPLQLLKALVIWNSPPLPSLPKRPIAGLELRAVAGVAAELQAEGDRHIRRGRGDLRVGNNIHFFISTASICS